MADQSSRTEVITDSRSRLQESTATRLFEMAHSSLVDRLRSRSALLHDFELAQEAYANLTNNDGQPTRELSPDQVKAHESLRGRLISIVTMLQQDRAAINIQSLQRNVHELRNDTEIYGKAATASRRYDSIQITSSGVTNTRRMPHRGQTVSGFSAGTMLQEQEGVRHVFNGIRVRKSTGRYGDVGLPPPDVGRGSSYTNVDIQDSHVDLGDDFTGLATYRSPFLGRTYTEPTTYS